MTTSPNLVPAGLTASLRQRLSADFQIAVDFTLEPGINVLFGPSGSGKTSILQMIAGLARPDEGTIRLRDRILFDSSSGVDLPPQHRQVGYVFQHLALFPHMSAAENVMFGLAHLSRSEQQQRARMLLDEFFGVSHLSARSARELSGGEKQRVALARALAPVPRLLLLDEPLSALDSPTKSRILEEIRSWARVHPIPIVYVTHDREEIFSAAQHVIVLEAGRKISEGSPEDALFTPRSFVLARAAGFENVFQARVTGRHDDSGTMTCELGGVSLECPLPHDAQRDKVGIAIRAGDILLAVDPPKGLSARNIIAGTITRMDRRDHSVAVRVTCAEDGGEVNFVSHVTRQAVDGLGLQLGKLVWLVIKTHSCHILLD